MHPFWGHFSFIHLFINESKLSFYLGSSTLLGAGDTTISKKVNLKSKIKELCDTKDRVQGNKLKFKV
jgi:hypothetical protein